MREATVISIQREVPAIHLPEGEHAGKWGGYVVNATIGGKSYVLHTNVGVRGMNVPCVVKVHGGIVSIAATPEAGDGGER